MGDTIKDFSGHHKFLSNFSGSPIDHDGKMWRTVEHLFQGLKCASLHDRELIRQACTPGEAKRLGRRIRMRSDWEEAKDKVM